MSVEGTGAPSSIGNRYHRMSQASDIVAELFCTEVNVFLVHAVLSSCLNVVMSELQGLATRPSRLLQSNRPRARPCPKEGDAGSEISCYVYNDGLVHESYVSSSLNCFDNRSCCKTTKAI